MINNKLFSPGVQYSPFAPEPTEPFQRFGWRNKHKFWCYEQDVPEDVVFAGYEGNIIQFPVERLVGHAPRVEVARLLHVTFFKDRFATSLKTRDMTLAHLRDLIVETNVDTKGKETHEETKGRLPWLKLAKFGEQRSKKNSLRHDGNMLLFDGMEFDYDQKVMPIDEAIAILKKAQLYSLVYTSPSYKPSAPKWRILLPTSKSLPPEMRLQLVQQVSRLFGDIFSKETFAASQAYFFGSVNKNPDHHAVIVDGDYIDLCDAAGEKKAKTTLTREDKIKNWEKYLEREKKKFTRDDIAEHFENIRTGAEFHIATRTISMHLVKAGTHPGAVVKLLRGLMNNSEAPHNERWKTRFDDIPRTVEGAEEECKAEQIEDEKPKEIIEPVDLWAQREAPPLPKGLLPKVIEKFAFRQAKLMGCDPAGLAMGALVVCCAVIPDRIKVQVKKHDGGWKASTRIWVAYAGLPSVQKSPITDRVTQPLNRIDAELSKKYQEEMAAYQALEGEEKKIAVKPEHERVRIEDVTPEAAQPILRDSPNGVLLVRDELSGWFGSIDKYSGARGGGMDRGFWLQAFNGGVYSWDRVSRGSGNIPNLSICVLGGIQEEPLRKLVNDGVDDGLIQRLFIIMLRRAIMGTDEPQPEDQYDDLVERLYALRRNFGHDERQFSEEAQVVRRQIEQQCLDLAAGYEKINKKLAAHVAKYHGLFARLCLLWHTIETLDDKWPSFIDVDVAQRVAKFMNEFLLQHAIAFYIGLLGLSDQHDRLLEVGGYILAHKLDTLTTRDIQRGSRSMREMEKRDTDRVFEQMEAYGWLTRKSGKRFSDVIWEVNPEVHRVFTKKAKEELERRERERAEIVASMPKGGG